MHTPKVGRGADQWRANYTTKKESCILHIQAPSKVLGNPPTFWHHCAFFRIWCQAHHHSRHSLILAFSTWSRSKVPRPIACNIYHPHPKTIYINSICSEQKWEANSGVKGKHPTHCANRVNPLGRNCTVGHIARTAILPLSNQ